MTLTPEVSTQTGVPALCCSSPGGRATLTACLDGGAAVRSAASTTSTTSRAGANAGCSTRNHSGTLTARYCIHHIPWGGGCSVRNYRLADYTQTQMHIRGGSRVPCRRGANPRGGSNIWFCQIFQKTA